MCLVPLAWHAASPKTEGSKPALHFFYCTPSSPPPVTLLACTSHRRRPPTTWRKTPACLAGRRSTSLCDRLGKRKGKNPKRRGELCMLPLKPPCPLIMASLLTHSIHILCLIYLFPFSFPSSLPFALCLSLVMGPSDFALSLFSFWRKSLGSGSSGNDVCVSILS